jgi:acetate kinase
MPSSDTDDLNILSINSESSSLKCGLFRMSDKPASVYMARASGIGSDEDSRLTIENNSGKTIVDKAAKFPDHSAALDVILSWLKETRPDMPIDVIGHRLVHGGSEYIRPQVITPDIEEHLHKLIPLAPDHLPRELDALDKLRRLFPETTQVACFDTTFHRNMPRVARIYPLPRNMFEHGIMRYGFHGLSYEYILQKLEDVAGNKIAEQKVIIAHLGSGASMVAVEDGQSIDTTMGFTPAGGLVMSTRTGDLDPGIFPHLLMHKKWPASAINEMINQKSGLLGVSGISASMKDLVAKEESEPEAREAIELFCYQATKFLGALIAVLGGLNTLVFTGGIGEKSAEIRQRICRTMAYAGIELNHDANSDNAEIISANNSRVTVRVMETNEEYMVALHAGSLVRGRTGVSYEQDKYEN